MQKLYILSGIYDAAYIATASFLYAKRNDLAENNILYNPELWPFWQIFTHEAIGLQLTAYCLGLQNKAGAPYLQAVENIVTAKMKRLNDDAASGKDVLCFYWACHPGSLALFFSRISEFPALRRCQPHAIMLAGRQDGELRTHGYRLWKTASFRQVSDIMFGHEHHKLNETYGILTTHCGKNNCNILPHNSLSPHVVDNSLLEQLATTLRLPARAIEGPWQQATFPMSAQGLDMARALFDFPFSFKEKQQWNRNAFYSVLRHVEQEEGHADVTFMPQAEAHTMLAACEPGNAKLSKTLGMETLFASPHPLDALPDAPSVLPEMSPEQCRAFVSAFTPEWQQGFLRYFRDLARPLHTTEQCLAAELEGYRRRFHPAAPFSWPRPVPTVAVLTLCWNQEAFIERCMESVTAQVSDFPIEHIIVDHNSSDNSAEIINRYASHHPHMKPFYLPSHEDDGENVRTLFSLCRSQYAALCDGDDYFTDPLKLQKQVDFLENNPDCAICFHPVDVIYDDGSPPRVYPPEECLPGGVRTFYSIKDLLCGNFIQTNSAMYRWRFREGLPGWFQPTLVPGDLYWHLLHAETGSIGYLPGHMSVYRRHAASLYASAEVGHVEHRRQHGLNELRTYHECNKHFRGRYYKNFFWLAVGVFTDFMQIYINTGDDALLQKGAEVAPDFARDFLAQLSLQGNGVV